MEDGEDVLTGLIHGALVSEQEGKGGWFNRVCCVYILRRFMADLCRIDKYLNTGPVSDFVLATKYILDSWSREEKGEYVGGTQKTKGWGGGRNMLFKNALSLFYCLPSLTNVIWVNWMWRN